MEPLSRAETLEVLSSMGVELPPSTRLPDDALDKRLKQALNAAQYFSTTVQSTPVDPSTISAWPPYAVHGSEEEMHSVQAALTRGNISEALANERARMFGMLNAVDLYVNPMQDLRQTVMAIGRLWDSGGRCCLVQDPDSQRCAINIRFVSVHQLAPKTPLVVLLYRAFTRGTAAQGAQWVQAQMRTAGKTGQPGITNIKATVLEQKVLLKLLGMNAKQFSPTFRPRLGAAEQGFKASFLLPVGPLSFEDLGRLNVDTGCVVCGEHTTSRCTQCMSVSYCGRECQRAHWPEHKQTCRSLKGGTWRTIRFANSIPGFENAYRLTLNRFSTAADASSAIVQVDNKTPPPNIHGSKTFIVKLQVGPQGQYMVYDRQRSFEVYFVDESDPTAFAEFRNVMVGPGGAPSPVKMYRWAKRVGEWELSVCIDRVPQEDIKW